MQAGEGGAHGDEVRVNPANPAPLPRRSVEEAREREGRARRLSAELESAELLAGDAPGRFLVVAAGARAGPVTVAVPPCSNSGDAGAPAAHSAPTAGAEDVPAEPVQGGGGMGGAAVAMSGAAAAGSTNSLGDRAGPGAGAIMHAAEGGGAGGSGNAADQASAGGAPGSSGGQGSGRDAANPGPSPAKSPQPSPRRTWLGSLAAAVGLGSVVSTTPAGGPRCGPTLPH